MHDAAVAIEDLAFSWGGRPALDIERLAIARGERVLLRGASGSGKSTLLGIVSGVLAPARGRVTVLGRDLGALADPARDAFRARHVGLVFQMFNLLPWLPVMENVLLAVRFSGERRRRAAPDARAEASRLLAELGIPPAEFAARPVTELSIGQQQRVAVARALLGRPEIVIADEPTSALDADARDGFLRLLMAECGAAGATLLFASHDPALGDRFDRHIAMADFNRAPAGTVPA